MSESCEKGPSVLHGGSRPFCFFTSLKKLGRLDCVKNQYDAIVIRARDDLN